MAADHGDGDFAVDVAPAASSASDDMPRKLGVPADRQAMRGGDADADAGEAARADADQDAGRPLRPSSSSAIIGTSRSAWPRPISSSARATQAPAPSNKAAVQAALDVSNARIMERIVVTSGAKPQPRRIRRLLPISTSGT